MRFHKLLFILVAILSVTVITQAQVYVGVQGGLGFSSFEDQDEGATAIPVAVTVGTDLLPIVDAGVEANFLASPYKFDVVDAALQTTEVEINQTIFGAYVRWYVLPLPALSPYVKGGVGYYSGKWKSDAGDVDLKSTVGFNIGAGVDLLMGLYGEVVYHIVSMEADVSGAESMGYNSIQVQIGYSFDLL
jgi:opacity protein-like surface antigen